jgi:hypothetical protein
MSLFPRGRAVLKCDTKAECESHAHSIRNSNYVCWQHRQVVLLLMRLCRAVSVGDHHGGSDPCAMSRTQSPQACEGQGGAISSLRKLDKERRAYLACRWKEDNGKETKNHIGKE